MKQLQKMKTLKVSVNEDTGELSEIDQSLWPKLGESIDAVMDERYVSVQTTLNPGRRMEGSKDDIPLSNSLLLTAENKLTSLVKNLAMHLKERL